MYVYLYMCVCTSLYVPIYIYIYPFLALLSNSRGTTLILGSLEALNAACLASSARELGPVTGSAGTLISFRQDWDVLDGTPRMKIRICSSKTGPPIYDGILQLSLRSLGLAVSANMCNVP